MSEEEIKGTFCEDKVGSTTGEREISSLCEYSFLMNERSSQSFKINWLVSSSLEINVHEPLFREQVTYLR